MKKIILISGKSNNGKSEFTKLIKNKLESQGKKVVVMAFAKYIKMYLKDYFGWDGVTKTEEVRSHLQRLGTDKIRNQMNMSNFHVERVCTDIKVLEDDFDYFILDDVRFHNEIYYTKAMFGNDVITIRVNRINFESPLTLEQQNHSSEVALDNFRFDYCFYNHNMNDLKKASNEIVENLLK